MFHDCRLLSPLYADCRRHLKRQRCKKLAEQQTLTFPESARGTYILNIYLTHPAVLTIGRLGTFPFLGGWYTYVGSAFGAGGLRGRLNHHLSQKHSLHWHIDYLRQSASISEIWYLASQTAYEHIWASLLLTMPQASIPVNRFGASDCKCPSHLFYFPTRPSFDSFHALTRTHGDVRCWQNRLPDDET